MDLQKKNRIFFTLNKNIKYLHRTQSCGSLSCLDSLANFVCLFTSINILIIYLSLRHDDPLSILAILFRPLGFDALKGF